MRLLGNAWLRVHLCYSQLTELISMLHMYRHFVAVLFIPIALLCATESACREAARSGGEDARFGGRRPEGFQQVLTACVIIVAVRSCASPLPLHTHTHTHTHRHACTPSHNHGLMGCLAGLQDRAERGGLLPYARGECGWRGGAGGAGDGGAARGDAPQPLLRPLKASHVVHSSKAPPARARWCMCISAGAPQAIPQRIRTAVVHSLSFILSLLLSLSLSRNNLPLERLS